ncbi:ExbD/TolR family protein [Alkalimarinus alittae]|uniref:Biopolymer transporter ExbD n=1 Tax=Alkalimarinus alittae TaxID=2961619 RepID=A0ABY6N2L2_9ALTE|nr:biopolymer transporter ExbD [Alkalimarinus alittae]UZE96353.1 biopolymer transporter ExbD [Alkalimarinus alittae]
MIKCQKPDDKTLGSPELAPLIDIIFMVVVFLLITANTPLLTLPIDVPSTDKDATLNVATQTELTITITADQPYWHMDKQAFSEWGDFKRALLMSTQNKQQRLTIAADKTAPTEPLLKLLSLLDQHKIANAQIIMQQRSE